MDSNTYYVQNENCFDSWICAKKTAPTYIINFVRCNTQNGALQLWRAEGVTSKEVLEEFNDRAHITDEIWKNNDTIDFTIYNEETLLWRELLEDHNITITVLQENITEQVDEKFIQKYKLNRRDGAGASPSLENNTSLMKNVTEKIGDKRLNTLENMTSSNSSEVPSPAENNNTLFVINSTEKSAQESTNKLEITTSGNSEATPQDLNFTLQVENITEKMDFDYLVNTEARRANVPPLNLKKRLTFWEISVYLHQLAAAYPKYLFLNTMDKTVHKNDIYLVKITLTPDAPIVMLESGIHANDWVGVLASLYFIDTIARNFSSQPTSVSNKNWHIIPVLNPDGYDFNMKKDHLWRKNTRRISSCVGVDLNRNFGFNWGGNGDIENPCNKFYCGPEPFSEKETKAVKNFIKDSHLYAYISIHSFGGHIYYPSAPGAFNIHVATSSAIAGAMRKVANHPIRPASLKTLGNARGVSIDWTHYRAKVTHSYVMQASAERIGDRLMTSLKEIRAGLMKLADLLKVHSWPGKRR